MVARATTVAATFTGASLFAGQVFKNGDRLIALASVRDSVQNHSMDENAVDAMETRLSAKLDNLAKEFNVALEAAGAGIRAHIDERIGQVMDTLGGSQDQKIALLEARIAKLEALLSAAGAGR